VKATLRAAAVQMQPHPPGESERNVELICGHVGRLAGQGVELVAFPELSVSNFFCERGGVGEERPRYWEQAAETVDGPSLAAVGDCAREHGVHVVVGFAERTRVAGVVYNSAALLGPDGLVGVVRKAHPAGYEKLYYSPGGAPAVFETPLGTIGLAICWDAWHPEYVRTLAALGAEVVVFINAVWKGLAKGGIGLQNKQLMWETVPVVRAFENGIFLVACNGSGSHFMGDRYGTWERMGRSRIIDPHGTVLAASDHDADDVVIADLHEPEIAASRSAYPLWADRRPELFDALRAQP
jgi:predicted amidohydrolase